MEKQGGRRVPGYVVGIVFIYLLSFGTAYLMAWADLLAEFLPLTTAFFFAVMLAGVIFPTGRKNGGCGLGCGLSIVASIGVACGVACFPGRPQDRPMPREALPVPRYLKGVQPTVDGIPLDLPASRVKPGSRVEVRAGRVVRVEGQELAQQGRVLVRAGDTESRATDVLQPGMSLRQVFRRDGYTFTLTVEGDVVRSIVMSRGD